MEIWIYLTTIVLLGLAMVYGDIANDGDPSNALPRFIPPLTHICGVCYFGLLVTGFFQYEWFYPLIGIGLTMFSFGALRPLVFGFGFGRGTGYARGIAAIAGIIGILLLGLWVYFDLTN